MNILDFLFPNHTCLVCKTELNGNSNPLICDTCFAALPVAKKVCRKCGGSITVGANVCNRCKGGSNWKFTLARSPFIYAEPIVALIMRLKYNGEGDIAKAMAPHMTRIVEQNNITADIIVPVPLAKKRMKQRGYNQALLLAREVSKFTNIPVDDSLLVRVKQTVAQKEMTLTQRQANLKNVFEVTNKLFVKGKSILLVDDVFTTGTTANECAKVLKKAGATSVAVVTVANVTYKPNPTPKKRKTSFS